MLWCYHFDGDGKRFDMVGMILCGVHSRFFSRVLCDCNRVPVILELSKTTQSNSMLWCYRVDDIKGAFLLSVPASLVFKRRRVDDAGATLLFKAIVK